MNEKAPTSQENVINILPFQLNYDGVAPVKSYFLINKKQNGEYVSHFRGRRLIGKDFTVPYGVTAINAVVPTNKDLGPGSKIEIQNEYSSFRQWQHDCSPDPSSLQECFDWMEIADAVRLIPLILLCFLTLVVAF
jgi:hypothetical protein